MPVLGAIDWTDRFTFREDRRNIRPWVTRVLSDQDLEEGGIIAFACAVGERWKGAVLLYAGDKESELAARTTKWDQSWEIADPTGQHG